MNKKSQFTLEKKLVTLSSERKNILETAKIFKKEIFYLKKKLHALSRKWINPRHLESKNVF